MLSPVRTAAPGATPVSLTEVKAHCRVDGTDSDTVLTLLLAAAVSHLDGWSGILGRCMVTQSWRQDFGGFASCLRLPLGPVASITSVQYYDAANAQQTLSTDVYTLRSDALGAYVDLKVGQSWPSSYTRPDAVSVTYVAGTDAAEVPAALKAAILLMVSHWNENREAVVTGTIATELPMSAAALIAPFRRVGV
jgi:uncharacterized phiE125 gp8 family phage protein